jgi:murein DD-endopeptidase MepM/ murein hydrolase activator NlpD
VYAANSGTVVESSDGWNGGYGNYIIIKHSNGSYSLYGHLSLRLVSIGDTVDKGELIGYVGNTGYTVGPTGCHLHFEIRGASNPLLK